MSARQAGVDERAVHAVQPEDVEQFDQALKMGIIVDVIFVSRTSLISEVPVQSGNYAASAVWRLFTVLEVPDIAEDV